MRIRIISDTHGRHEEIKKIESDILIHCGDATNYKNRDFNREEFFSFWKWFQDYPAEHKVYVPGNHDSMLSSITKEEKIELSIGLKNTLILIDQGVTINGIKIWGSPYTPTFGEWFFMCKREKIQKHWDLIPEGTDILVTHGPPKGILDLSENRDGKLEFCGDKNLLNTVYKIKPQLHAFGHIHSNKSFKNEGVLLRDDILFVNASCVTDGQIESGPITQGFMFDENFNIK